jgi:hypothetical protein
MPGQLDVQLRAVAARDHNGLSSTLRRLLSEAVERELARNTDRQPATA